MVVIVSRQQPISKPTPLPPPSLKPGDITPPPADLPFGDSPNSTFGVFVLVDLATQLPSSNVSLPNCDKVEMTDPHSLIYANLCKFV